MKRFWHNLTTRYAEVSPVNGGAQWEVYTGHLPACVWHDVRGYGLGVAAYNLWFRLFK